MEHVHKPETRIVMHCCVLGSSSAGNCTAIWDHSSTIIVDCGFSPRDIDDRIRSLPAPLVSGLLITHVHGDHVNRFALAHFLKRDVPVFLPKRISKILERRYEFFRRARKQNLVRDSTGVGVLAGTLDIRSFLVPHDSPGGCYGYVVRTISGSSGKSIAIATDLGYPEDGLKDFFVDRDAIIVESNYDNVMLEQSGRPEWLKRRIRELGHLSNAQCASFLSTVFEGSSRQPHTVVLAHISQECNTNSLALECTQKALESKGFHGVTLVPTFPNKASQVVSV